MHYSLICRLTAALVNACLEARQRTPANQTLLATPMHPVKYGHLPYPNLTYGEKIGAELRGVSRALKPSLDKLSRENNIRISLYKYFHLFGLADGRHKNCLCSRDSWTISGCVPAHYRPPAELNYRLAIRVRQPTWLSILESETPSRLGPSVGGPL